jgi:hypothetical protein
MRQFLWRAYRSQPKLKRFVWQTYEWLIRLKPRHQTDYATHIPILAAISLLANPKNITEFGSGEYSTSLFLNRSVFPNAGRVVSLENDVTWFARMRSKLEEDKRLDLRLIDGDLSHAVTEQLLAADLVFIDDSSAEIRKNTITAGARQCPEGVPVVIHDAEYIWTRMAIRHFDHYFVFNAFQPQTAVAWNGNLRFKDDLPRLSRAARHALEIPPTNGEQWRIALASSLASAGVVMA